MYVILGAEVSEIWNESGLSISYSGGRTVTSDDIPADLNWLEREYCRISFDLQGGAETNRTLCGPLGWIYMPELLRILVDENRLPWEQAIEALLNSFELPESGFEEYPLDGINPRLQTLWIMFKHEMSERIVHDHTDLFYRNPLGAAVCGSKISLSVSDSTGLADGAELIFGGTSIPCRGGNGIFCASTVLTGEPQLVFYNFRLSFGGILIDEPNKHTVTVTVYSPDFITPAKFHGCTMYQIFPDRFSRAGQINADYHAKMGRRTEIHSKWDEPVKWTPSEGEEHYSPNDYYGGNLKGIIQKLPYLDNLGVTAIYLNPIFEADSNHRYNTADYRKIDPMLGTEEDFTLLCRECEKHGISVVLDGVFSHTGSDSVYFDKRGVYGGGAYSDPDSPYRSWYDFSSYPEHYRSWWGFDSLPEVNEHDPSWQDYILGLPDGVIPHWLHAEASGFRLDVADELPDEVLELLRSSVKQTDPGAIIIGEVWENAVTKISYDRHRTYALGNALDSVMNYPLRNALISFAINTSDAYQLTDFLLSQKLDYPAPLYYCLMNLLSSHDVPRIRTVLSLGSALEGISREKAASLKVSAQQDELGAQLQSLCAVLQFVLPGFPCVYYGDELGMQGASDPFNRGPFMPGGRSLEQLYATLGQMRKDNADILSEGDVRFQPINSDCLCIIRNYGTSELVAAVNRGDELTVSLHVPDGCTVSPCLLCGQPAQIHFGDLNFVCMHNEAHIFRVDI